MAEEADRAVTCFERDMTRCCLAVDLFYAGADNARVLFNRCVGRGAARRGGCGYAHGHPHCSDGLLFGEAVGPSPVLPDLPASLTRVRLRHAAVVQRLRRRHTAEAAALRARQSLGWEKEVVARDSAIVPCVGTPCFELEPAKHRRWRKGQPY